MSIMLGIFFDFLHRFLRKKINNRLPFGLFLALFISSPLLAIAPGELNYQGKLTDTVGNPLSGAYNIRFQIYDSPTVGSILYDRTRSNVPVNNGLFNVAIGTAPAEAIPSSVFQGGTDRWLQISVNGVALLPREKLLASPYALSVAVDSVGTNEVIDSAITLNDLDTSSVDVRYLDASNLNAGTVPNTRINGAYTNITGMGTQTQNLNMGTSFRIINLADPQSDQEAATRAYVDSQTGSATYAP